MEEKFTIFINILDRDHTRNETVSGMLEEPLGTVVSKAVINFVAQSCTVVLQFDKIS